MEKRPNILLMLADDMGFSDIGAFGSEIRTPNLDGMARDGLIGTQMYNCARCCPSRAALLTGLYPHNAGIGHMMDPAGRSGYRGELNDECVTLAEVLRGAGYHTGMSGKWHVGGEYRSSGKAAYPQQRHPTPLQRGFERFYGTLHGAASYYNPHTLFDQDRPIRVAADEAYYYTDAIADRAMDMMEDFARDGAPFFQYVAFTAPHWPLHAPKEDIRRYIGNYRGGWEALRRERYARLKALGIIREDWELSRGDEAAPPWDTVANPDWEDMRMAVYAAQIDRMDQAIGRILSRLDALGCAENTLVLFMSDNGGCAEFLREDPGMLSIVAPMRTGQMPVIGNIPGVIPGGEDTYMSYDLPWANASNTPFRYYKHWVHEGGISTPLICRWPKGIRAGSRIDRPLHFIDILPTCAALGAAAYPERFEGREILPCNGEDFSPAFSRSDWHRSRPIFWEHEGNCAVRDGRYKLVKRRESAWELYDMECDRTEIHDLAAAEPSRVLDMAQAYERWAADNRVAEYDTLYGGNP